MTDRRINNPSPRDHQVRRLRNKHGLSPWQAELLARWHFGERQS